MLVSNIYSLVSFLQRLCQILIAWCHAYRDCFKYYSLVSCIQRLCQILQLGVNVYRDCFKYYSLVSCLQRLFQIFSLMSCLEIASNIIVWCHVYRDCVKYFSLVLFLSSFYYPVASGFLQLTPSNKFSHFMFLLLSNLTKYQKDGTWMIYLRCTPLLKVALSAKIVNFTHKNYQI